ncbi:uncharacterized protein N7482_005003, partial [Penicillium canariense]
EGDVTNRGTDTSIVATSIYTIALNFNSLSGSLWVVLAYTLAFISSHPLPRAVTDALTGCAVIFARSSDFVGRRTAVIAAFTLFIAFSLACGFSRNITQLIIFRALQGVGGAGLYALPLILLVEAGTLDLKLLTSSLIGASISLAGAVGPVRIAVSQGIIMLNAGTDCRRSVDVPCELEMGVLNQVSVHVASSLRKISDFPTVLPSALLLLSSSLRGGRITLPHMITNLACLFLILTTSALYCSSVHRF